MAGNSILKAANKAKNDEFYTQLTDIEKEMKYYRNHFKGKTVFCNCDDPFESNFFKYFVLNFNRLGLKKLISTCYVSSSIVGTQLKYFEDDKGQLSFSFGEEQVEVISSKKPYKAIVTTVHDTKGDGSVDMFDVARLFEIGENKLCVLDGDGDFRSDECIELLKEADIVVTNPPFSLFRDFVSILVQFKKKFIIIGNKNSVTYKELFPLIMNGDMWIGARNMNSDFWLYVPNDYSYEKLDEGGNRLKHIMACWFTNLDIKKRHEKLILYKNYSPDEYPQYDNYDAININVVQDIPYDYEGVMGVPITFLDKYNPEQFEILGLVNGKDDLVKINTKRDYTDFKEMRQDGTFTGSNGKKINGNPVLQGKPSKGNYFVFENETVYSTYARIFIKKISN